jgi:hypothetical protein
MSRPPIPAICHLGSLFGALACIGCAATVSPERLAADRAAELQSARAAGVDEIDRQYAAASVRRNRELLLERMRSQPRGATPAEMSRMLAALAAEPSDCSGLTPQFDSVVGICTKSLETSRSEFKRSQTVTLVLTAAGALAGSVGVPALVAASAANAVWIAALGGLSGGVNALNLTARDVGVSPDKLSSARRAFLDAWSPLIAEYASKRGEGKCGEAAAALDKAYFACLAYLNGIADATPLTGLPTATTTTTSTTTTTTGR